MIRDLICRYDYEYYDYTQYCIKVTVYINLFVVRTVVCIQYPFPDFGLYSIKVQNFVYFRKRNRSIQQNLTSTCGEFIIVTSSQLTPRT